LEAESHVEKVDRELEARKEEMKGHLEGLKKAGQM
jgi:hypothetical protein